MSANPLNPRILVYPFAATSSLKDNIPDSGAYEPGSGSYSTGFPNETMIPIAAGGTPPRGQTFNGVFGDITENLFYLQRGVGYRFDGRVLQSAKSGYPRGAVLRPNDISDPYWYESAIDGNTIDFNSVPESIGVQWKRIMLWEQYFDNKVYPVGFVAIGSDDTAYIAVQQNGPGTAGGIQNPTSSTGYWKTLKEYYTSSAEPVKFVAPINKRIASFSTGGTYSWTVPDFNGDGTDWMAWIWVKGGGAGGGAGHISGLPHGGRSGGAGCLVKKYAKLTPGDIYAVTVGAGGPGRAAGSGIPDGTVGGTSAFGSLISSPGGNQGFGGNKSPADGEDVTPGMPGVQRIPSSWNGSRAFQAEGGYGGECAARGGGGNAGTFPVDGTTNANGLAGGAGNAGYVDIYAIVPSA